MGEKVGVWLSLEPKQVKWLETMTKKYGLPTAGTYYYRVVLLPLGAYNKHTSEENTFISQKGTVWWFCIMWSSCVCVCVCVCVLQQHVFTCCRTAKIAFFAWQARHFVLWYCTLNNTRMMHPTVLLRLAPKLGRSSNCWCGLLGCALKAFCFKTKQASRKCGELGHSCSSFCFCEELPNHMYVLCMYVWYQNCIDCKPLILSVTGFAKLSKEDLICNTNSISEIVGSDWICSKFELEICMLILHKHLRIWLHIQHACTKSCTSMQFWSTGFGFGFGFSVAESCFVILFFPLTWGICLLSTVAEHGGRWWQQSCEKHTETWWCGELFPLQNISLFMSLWWTKQKWEIWFQLK